MKVYGFSKGKLIEKHEVPDYEPETLVEKLAKRLDNVEQRLNDVSER